MTAEEFDKFWVSTYPGTVPIGHFFKYNYPDRWFRIHSLPKSKRYAKTVDEWDILLGRQNQIITDILGNNSKTLLVTGDYYCEDYEDMYPISAVKSIANIPFISLEPIDLNKINPDDYDSGQTFRPIFSEQTWHSEKFNNLLKDIAEDELRAFFISIENKCIVAPYDGGIDFILKDEETKNFYKEKYKDWLSERQDGM